MLIHKIIFTYSKKYRLELAIAFLFVIIIAFSILSIGQAARHFINIEFSQYNNSQYKDKSFAIFYFLGIISIFAISSYIKSLLLNSVCNKIISDIRMDLYKKTLLLPFSFFQKKNKSEILSKIINDGNLIHENISNNISFLIRNFILIWGSVIFLFTISIKLTLIIFFAIIVTMSILVFLVRQIKLHSGFVREKMSNINTLASEIIDGIKLVKLNNKECDEIAEFYKINNEYIKAYKQKTRLQSFVISLMIFISFLILGLTIYIGSEEVISGKMQSGELVSFLFYSTMIAISSSSISELISKIQTSNSAADSIDQFLAYNDEFKNDTSSEVNFNIDSELQFHDISFDYNGKRVLNDANVIFSNNKKIAIIGKNGEGKSTIISLITKLIAPKSGKITLNNIDIAKLPDAELRKIFCYIGNDSIMFSGKSIFENITYGEENLNISSVIQNLKNCKLVDFIGEFNEFTTKKPQEFSSGERQKILLAKAIITTKPVILLDEATAFIDKESEFMLGEIIKTRLKNKMIIMISHKSPIVQDFDEVYEIDSGKLQKI